jgi:hypothetical protein
MRLTIRGGRRVGVTNAIALLAAGRVAELPREEARELLRPHRKQIGARRAIGRKYIDPKDLPTMGKAIEKRARKAAKRRLEEASSE